MRRADPGPGHVPSPNVAEVIDLILQNEGGVADVGDGAGLTRWGQTAVWLADYGLPTPESLEQAADNYARWMAMEWLDLVAEFDAGLAYAVADEAVNEGISAAVKHLQAPLGVTVDGSIGPMTIAAMQRSNPHILQAAVVAATVEAKFAILAQNPLDLKFAVGWGHRCGDQIRRLG